MSSFKKTQMCGFFFFKLKGDCVKRTSCLPFSELRSSFLYLELLYACSTEIQNKTNKQKKKQTTEHALLHYYPTYISLYASFWLCCSLDKYKRCERLPTLLHFFRHKITQLLAMCDVSWGSLSGLNLLKSRNKKAFHIYFFSGGTLWHSRMVPKAYTV